MFTIANQAEFDAGLDSWIAACTLLAEEAFRGMSWAAFDYIAKGTPQWSGNLAGSWTLSIGAPVSGMREKPLIGAKDWRDMTEPFEIKHPLAVGFAEAVARPVLASIHLGTDVYITNPSPYALPVQENVHEVTGKPFLREVNKPVEMVYQVRDRGVPGFGPELSEAVIVRYTQGTL